MNVEQERLLSERHCKRQFLSKSIERATLEEALILAQNAPSSKNTQSWQVAILTGNARDTLSEKLCRAFDSGEKPRHDYQYLPDPVPEYLMQRARECGYALFNLKGIARDDYEARRLHDRENFLFFGAPCIMILHLEKDAPHGMFLDMGLYLQNLMLALVAKGLHSCPQYSVAGYADIIREHLGYKDRLIVCGLSVGYVDQEAKVNSFIPERLPLEAFTDWR